VPYFVFSLQQTGQIVSGARQKQYPPPNLRTGSVPALSILLPQLCVTSRTKHTVCPWSPRDPWI